MELDGFYHFRSENAHLLLVATGALVHTTTLADLTLCISPGQLSSGVYSQVSRVNNAMYWTFYYVMKTKSAPFTKPPWPRMNSGRS